MKLPLAPGTSTTHTRVVKALQVIKHIAARLVPGPVMGTIHTLALEYAEEPFARHVVVAVTYRTRAAGEVMVFEEQFVVCTGELRAAARNSRSCLQMAP